MAGKKPGPDPTGRTVRQVSVALRHEDVDALQRLANERLALGADGDPEAMFTTRPRPSVSSAIRHLVDAERERRLTAASKRWRKDHPGKPAPTPDDLLRDDFVFGTPGGPKTFGALVARLEPHAVVDGTLQRVETHEPAAKGDHRPAKLSASASGRKKAPKKKAAKRKRPVSRKG